MVAMNYDASAQRLEIGPFAQWLNIPQEMRSLRQWAVSTLTVGSDGKPDKRPRRADGSEMEWRSPLAWLTFEEAVNSGYPAIGFILTSADPFTIIDLDVKADTPTEVLQRHEKILGAFPTYTEYSQSGQGLHIILQGRIGGGVRRDGVEVYDQDRYMICTGNIFGGRNQVGTMPDMLAQMVAEMGGVSTKVEMPDSLPEPCGDEELIGRMQAARNGERFRQLFYGPVDMGSENDAALISILAFWTQNHDQILRLFARSVLYRPRGEEDGKKGHSAKTYHEKYLMETLAQTLKARLSWDQQKEADVEMGRALAAGLKPSPDQIVPDTPPVDFPPGLIGELAEYIYQTAPRPMKEVAIAGALAMMAGICGRQYNVSSGVGLNLYIIMLAESGMGKEAAKNGVDRLFHAMAKEAPGLTSFLGPRVVSGQALEKAVAEHNPCFVSFVGEIGVRLQAMLSKRGGDPMMKAAWLGLYTAAVRGGVHQGAFHSKKEDRTSSIAFPAVTLYGESTPSEYYKAISGANFDDGFMPRFLTIVSHETQIRSLNPSRGLPPHKALVDKLVTIGQRAVDLQVREQFVEVEFGDGIRAEEVDAHYMKIASKMPAGPVRVCWTRAPMQMFKVAALIAVGNNPNHPVITNECMAWAARLVERSIGEIEQRQADGDLGSADSRKLPTLEKVIKEYYDTAPDRRHQTYKVPKALCNTPFIPYTFLRRRLKMKAEFYDDPRGEVLAIKAAVQDALDLEILVRASPAQVEQETKGAFKPRGGELYVLGSAWQGYKG